MLYFAWTTSFAAGSEGIFSGINLGIHEAGHLLTTWAPKVICAAAGSAAQCLAPMLAMIIFYRQQDWFALSFCLLWLGTNFNYVSWYMADAQALQGQLLTVGGGGRPVPKEDIHDWHVILKAVGLLEYDGILSSLVLLAGAITLWTAVIWAGWQLWQMHRGRPAT